MIRFGVIGTNWITEEFIRCARLHEEFELTAVYSRTAEKANEFAIKNRVTHIFTDLEEMASSDLIDAVYIASPNSFHVKQAALFLNNKKHVICEKPVASNTKELYTLIKSAKENGVVLMEAMKSTCLPNYKVIKKNLNKIGKVRRYFGTYCQYSSRYDKFKAGENPNTFNPEFSNGSLMDIGIYPIYPLIDLFGLPNALNACGVKLSSGVDGSGSIVFQYDDMDALVMHSKISNSNIPSEIQGEKGTMIINTIHTPEDIQIRYRNGEVENITVEQRTDIMYYEVEEFIKTIKIKASESAINTHNLSLNVMKVLDEARAQMGVKFPADNE